jgi:hypothetical protein
LQLPVEPVAHDFRRARPRADRRPACGKSVVTSGGSAPPVESRVAVRRESRA